jgi:hypothetical protein
MVGIACYPVRAQVPIKEVKSNRETGEKSSRCGFIVVECKASSLFCVPGASGRPPGLTNRWVPCNLSNFSEASIGTAKRFVIFFREQQLTKRLE